MTNSLKKTNTASNISSKGGKNIRNARQTLEKAKATDLIGAIKAIKETSYTKFTQTLDIAINLGIDVRKSDQIVRGTVKLPHGTGKNIKVAVVSNDTRQQEAKESGADFYNAQEIIDDIKKGNIKFDVCIATPDMMGLIGQVAKILGPKGLMPNPKLGTVTMDISQAIKNAKGGQIEYRNDKNGIIHAGIGKLSFSEEALAENASTLIQAVLKSKPQTSRGLYLKAINLSATMGPAVKINTSHFTIAK